MPGRRIASQTAGSPVCIGRCRCGHTFDRPAMTRSRRSSICDASIEESLRRRRSSRAQRRSMSPASVSRPARSHPNFPRCTPVSTSSRAPVATSLCAVSTTLRTVRLDNPPRVRGTMQNEQASSHPVCTLRLTRGGVRHRGTTGEVGGPLRRRPGIVVGGSPGDGEAVNSPAIRSRTTSRSRSASTPPTPGIRPAPSGSTTA